MEVFLVSVRCGFLLRCRACHDINLISGLSVLHKKLAVLTFCLNCDSFQAPHILLQERVRQPRRVSESCSHKEKQRLQDTSVAHYTLLALQARATHL